MKKLPLVVLVGILILGFFLRVYRLGEIPTGFHRDEAFLGYNAYSLLKTGKDMNGISMPTHLKSFLYTPAGYAYLSAPFVLLFGLSELAIRLPSAVFGSLTIIAVYMLVRLLWTRGKESEHIAIWASFLLAISSWHINLSRTASVITVIACLVTLGVVGYMYWLREKKWWLLCLSYILLGSCLLFYIAPYSFLPLFIPLLTAVFYKQIQRKAAWIFVSVLFFITIVVPVGVTVTSKELTIRARSISIFQHEEAPLVLGEAIREDGVAHTVLLVTRMFHNKVAEFTREILQNYTAHFSYDFLFTAKGFPNRYTVPLSGLLYMFELPLIALGAWILFGKHKKVALFLFGWIALVPVGSSLAFDDVPNLQRTLTLMPALVIVEAVGVVALVSYVQSLKQLYLRLLLFGGITLVMTYGFLFYMHQYYVHFPRYRPWYRNDGYGDLVEKVNGLLPQYEKAIITNRESAPAIFFLFYSKYDPATYQQETRDSKLQDFDRVNFGKYEFSQEECPLRFIVDANGKKVSTGQKNTLYVNSGLCEEFPNGEEFASIVRSDNSLVFRVLRAFDVLIN